jgi:hypothetical protein
MIEPDVTMSREEIAEFVLAKFKLRRRLGQCKSWADRAAALASYAKQADDEQLLNNAKRIKARGNLIRLGMRRPLSALGGNVTWCDKLASTPVVGLKLEWCYASGNKILDCLSPVLMKLNVGDLPAFSIDRIDPFSVVFTTNDGFQYSANADAISVGFTHRIKIKHMSGGNPALEVLSVAQPYGILLGATCKKLVEVAMLLPAAKGRTFKRIGIVSNTLVEESDFPPGISRLVKYFGRPWPQGLDSYNVETTARLKTGQEWVDRCIHRVTNPENPDSVPTLHFDWQRTFKAAHPLNEKTLNNDIAVSQQAALAYFEELAEGNIFDEDFISGADRT